MCEGRIESPMTESQRTPEQLKAQLKWALACERLTFALSPPAGADPESASGVLTAIERVQDALKELKLAFGSAGPTAHPDQAAH
mgnify:CR=1 FL=1